MICPDCPDRTYSDEVDKICPKDVGLMQALVVSHGMAWELLTLHRSLVRMRRSALRCPHFPRRPGAQVECQNPRLLMLTSQFLRLLLRRIAILLDCFHHRLVTTAMSTDCLCPRHRKACRPCFSIESQKVVLKNHETLYLPFLTVLP